MALRLLFVALATAIFILGGLSLFDEWRKLHERIDLQTSVIVDLSKMALEPKVNAAYDKATGDVLIMVNDNRKRLSVVPGLCPKVLEF